MKTLFAKKFVKLGSYTIVSLLLVVSQVQAETYYFHNDQLGTPQVVTDSQQQVAWKGEYDPFGKVTETVNIVEQNIRFPGQYFDSETELHYNYYRTYDPNNGRYIESDPIGLDGGINTYAYVMGNPISFIDPSGTIGFLAAIPFLGGAGGSTAVGGGLTVGKAVTGGILTGIMLSLIHISEPTRPY